MGNVKLVWITPDPEEVILKCARVSSPDPDNKDPRLLRYLLKHKHISPFQMSSMCVEVNTTRDISAQIIRHRSINVQEWSQRYSEVNEIVRTSPRRQDLKNRQNSTDDLDIETKDWWSRAENELILKAKNVYHTALQKGISKESARRILPMASATKLFLAATIRDWIFYLELRTANGTQKEHMDIANEIKEIFVKELPIISLALGYIEEQK